MILIWILLALSILFGLSYLFIFKVRIIVTINADIKQWDIDIVLRFLLSMVPVKISFQIKKQKDGMTLFITWKYKKRRIGTIQQLLRRRKSEKPFLGGVVKYLTFINFHADMQLGTNDAAATALLSGMIQTGSEVANSFIGNNGFIVQITPVFSGSYFNLRSTCILELKKANIIFDLIKLLIKI